MGIEERDKSGSFGQKCLRKVGIGVVVSSGDAFRAQLLSSKLNVLLMLLCRKTINEFGRSQYLLTIQFFR